MDNFIKFVEWVLSLHVDWKNLIIQLIAILFSLAYLIYALVFLQQLKKMVHNALIYEQKMTNNPNIADWIKIFLTAFSFLQIIIGMALILYAIFLL